MKIKELDRHGVIAWSTKHINDCILAVGSAQKQFEPSVSSNFQLEVFKFEPRHNGWDMPVVGCFSTTNRFCSLTWSSHDSDSAVIAGGDDNGEISIYTFRDVNDKFGKSLSRVGSISEHKGAVFSMDFNKSKTNLLASGGTESDIFVWDIEKLDEPMNSGQKSQPLEDILNLSWNYKVQHILGSASLHRSVIWDVRKPDPVIKLSDTQMKMKCKKIVWHPEISTRLCLVSADDNNSVIQLWDLRYIQCPLHTMQKHSKGIADVDWCVDDPDILVSVGKDRQIICWNMSSQNESNTPSLETIYEWQLDQESINEVRFCPKHPGLLAVSSFDCHVGVYSLMGGRGHMSTEFNTVGDSFPLDVGEEDFEEMERVKKEAEKAAELQLTPAPYLKKPPKWLKRRCGASFSFGGKLVQYFKAESSRSRNNSLTSTGSSTDTDTVGHFRVLISQVKTNQSLMDQSRRLDEAVQNSESLVNFCDKKSEELLSQIKTDFVNRKEFQFDLNIWQFIKCHFYDDSRSAFLEQLGYGKSVSDSDAIDIENDVVNDNNYIINDISQTSAVNNLVSDTAADHYNGFDNLPFDSIDLLPDEQSGKSKHISLPIALMTGNFLQAIKILLHEERYGEAALLAFNSGQEDLFSMVQSVILEKSLEQNQSSCLLLHIALKRNWRELVLKCNVKHWKEVLTWILTYVSSDELYELCLTLGKRLEQSSSIDIDDGSGYSPQFAACVCYVFCFALEDFIRCWSVNRTMQSTLELLRLFEMVFLLFKASEEEYSSAIKGVVADLFVKYANALIAEGNPNSALHYLGEGCEQTAELRRRIIRHLSMKQQQQLQPLPILSALTGGLSSVHNHHTVKSNFPTMQQQQQVPFGLPDTVVHRPNIDPVKPTLTATLNSFHNFPLNQSQSGLKTIPPPNQYHQQQPVEFNPPTFNASISSYPSYLKDNSDHQLFSAYFAPTNSNIVVPPPPTLPLSTQQMNSLNLSGKSVAWNDPPILSGTYTKYFQRNIGMSRRRQQINESSDSVDELVAEKSKPDGNVISPKFYNPASFIPMVAEISGLRSKHNSESVTFSPVSQGSFGDFSVSQNMEQTDGKEVADVSVEVQEIESALFALIDKCREFDKSRHTKVKMDDIQKKVANLNNVLVGHSASQTITASLKSITQCLKDDDVSGAFDEFNRLVLKINFSEGGSFMPSLKMLLQCASVIFDKSRDVASFG